MAAIEFYKLSPDGITRDIVSPIQFHNEKKYAFQVGLKDLDFDFNEELIKLIGLTIPFQSIVQAEQALRYEVIKPNLLIEQDDKEHQVLVFDPRPVVYGIGNLDVTFQ